MTNPTPHGQVPATQRYKIGYHSDEWGVRSNTPGGIPDPAGSWVLYEDHLAALVEAQQPAPSAAADLIAALEEARSAINSMKVEAETAGQGDEQMMLEACETISNEGLQADMAIRAALASAPQPAVQQGDCPTMDDAIAAGDGTLHGAIDHWQRRALDAERVLLSRGLVLEEAAKACEERERRANREDVRAACRLCAKDIRSLAVVNQSLTTGPTANPEAPAAQGDARAEQALLKVLTAVQRYLPPDGPSAKDTLSEIIGIIDPWPLGDQKGKA